MLDGLDDLPPRRWQSRTVLAAAATALVLVAAAGVALALRFVAAERERDLRDWQVRLGIVADSRAAAINDWLVRQLETVQGLAQNVSLQLYVTELAQANGDRGAVTDEASQAEYLRNLLVVTADRTGFTGAPLGARVPANVPRVGVAGLAIVDAQSRVLVATPDMPDIGDRLAALAGANPQKAAVLDLYTDAGGQPAIGFFAPVQALQADPGSPPIAVIVGIKQVAAELFPLLSRPPTAEKTAESILVRRAAATIEFLSPTADGTAALERRMPADTPSLAEAYIVANPGGFSLLRDYRDREVLATGRTIDHAPWTLVHKVDRAEALAESDARLDRLLVVLLLGLAAIVAGFVAAWRHGASRRAAATADRLKALMQKLESQASLLRIVTDSQPAAMFIVDEQERMRFANRLIAERAGTPAEDLIGKSLSSGLGPAEAGRHRKLFREALERGAAQPAVQRMETDAGPRIVHVEYIPLPDAAGRLSKVLVVEEDITAPILERDRRERTLRQLVRTLVALLDRRDPFAANHSQRVAAVARRIAEEMGLEPVEIETVDIAGSLMNLGKILVAPQILTRSGNISDEELLQIRQSLQAGADLLAGIEFDGPVVETLRQAQEQWGGGGPNGLRGEDILMTARIIAAANAFVAMISPRAHRPAISFDAAIRSLLERCESVFDRRVVAALINDLENRGGRQRWADFARPVG